MKHGRERGTADVFETKLHRLHLGKSSIVTAAVSALSEGAVHEVVDERLPMDETGRFVKPGGACGCAFCGELLSGEVAAAFVCQAPGCSRVACEAHRFTADDGQILCIRHDPWRIVLDLLWGCDEGCAPDAARGVR